MTKVKIACGMFPGDVVEEREVDAVRFGEWAATEVWPDYWTVTLIASGRHAPGCFALQIDVAAYVAERLNKTVPPIADWQAIPADVAKIIKRTAAEALAEVTP